MLAPSYFKMIQNISAQTEGGFRFRKFSFFWRSWDQDIYKYQGY